MFVEGDLQSLVRLSSTSTRLGLQVRSPQGFRSLSSAALDDKLDQVLSGVLQKIAKWPLG